VSVRQYLRSIKRLWLSDGQPTVDGVEKYWQEVVLGSETIVPPDRDDYPFSRVAVSDEDPKTLKRRLGLPWSASVPKPKTVTFEGLQSVLSQSRLAASWRVKVDDTGPPPDHEYVQLSIEQPVPKHILENAIEAADNFLQGAGVGFDIGGQPYMGGQEAGI
jgi:hypothetical protein